MRIRLRTVLPIMSKDIKEFPDLSNKLAAPSKKSLFERQKAEAEAKKAREEAETAAVYKDFVASFENDEDEDDLLSRMGGGRASGGTRGGFGGTGGGPKRHFAPGGPRGLNSGPGSLGPPPNKKRAFEGAFQPQRDHKREGEHGVFGQSDERRSDATAAFRHSDDEDEKAKDDQAEERAAPKPTLQLTQLPPGTSPAVIKALIPTTLTVDNVRILPPGGPGSTERRAMAAIVTLAKDTPASDIDTAVSSLQNRYLGYGFYLNISRHLSSAALGGGLVGSGLGSSNTALPFGAKAPSLAPNHPLNRAPPGLRGQFAPPTSYAPTQATRGQGTAQVDIRPPSDIKELKLIHKTVEALVTHGPEFEALLMSRPEVQQHQKWAWLWDPRSTGGVWYRWRLWQVLTGSGIDNRRRPDAPNRLFDAGASWYAPNRDNALKFEWTTGFDELVSDDDYGSSDEEDSDDEGRRRRQQQQERTGGPPDASMITQEPEKSYLNPLQKAKLTHLLARLPTTTAKLRKGDVARVTAFAISHAGAGADEVVDMIVSNVEKPFCWSGAANGEHDPDESAEDRDIVPTSELTTTHESSSNAKNAGDEQDHTSSKLIALYLISDILSSSSTSGVRHAWKYRQLFEQALRQRDIFGKLGRLEKDLKWGRLRAEKWRRSVDIVLRLWEGWSAFQQEAQRDFVEAFSNPPLTEEEKKVEEAKDKEAARRENRSASKWKSVDDDARPAVDDEDQDMRDADRDGDEIDAVDGLLPAQDSDGEPASDEELDGDPLDDSDLEETANTKDTDVTMKDIDSPAAAPQPSSEGQDEANSASRARRQRPRAVDMFADSDGE